ncbi:MULTISPECIES: DUF1835 domain-containing protein [Lysinibacillus]|uniref:DUF1835 domain-containing protein n=1 Tax=Lysinibacillus fusiformis TaxID=28031 RepID=A0A2I0V167_9BACI|nr:MULTISPECIES: DUF1835 domain-containing protein [Lysinibacillus]KUF33304.1 hypothetical protein AK833_11230 [Lysinibacillus sp. F5]PKU52050.1 hypothetical protein CRI88_06675 [Lysinibacillus fusiformis]
MEHVNKLKKAIKRMSEADAKSMLFLTLMNEQSKDDMVQFLLQQNEEQDVSTIETVHIVFGHSPGGSLKAAFRNSNYVKTEEIIVMPGNFSVGPLKDLHLCEGIEARFQWLQERYFIEDDGLAIFEREVKEAVEKIKSIPPHQDIIIWTCQNAHEQIGLRLVLAMLEKKPNDIYVLDTFQLFHELHIFPQLAEDNYPRSSGEVSVENVLHIYEQYQGRPLKKSVQQTLSKEGLKMLMDDYCIHTWEYNELWSHHNENVDDDWIIACAKRLHEDQEEAPYLMAARLIGEVLGHMEQYREAEWIEYRLRQLIQQGVFSYRGELKGMLHYQVKLADAYLLD